MLKELTTRAILHDEVEVVIILNHFVQLDYMRVSNFLQDCDFTVYPVDVRLVFDFIFFQDLDSHLVASYNVCTLFNLAKCAFAFRFTNDEPSDLLAFAVLLFFFALLAFTFQIRCRFGGIFASFFGRSLGFCSAGLRFTALLLFVISSSCIGVLLAMRNIPTLNGNIIILFRHFSGVVSSIVSILLIRQHVIFLNNNAIFILLRVAHLLINCLYCRFAKFNEFYKLQNKQYN